MKSLEYKAVIRQPEILNSLDQGALDKLISDYPYFATARIFLAKQLIDQGKSADGFLSKAAIYTSDRDRLKAWITGSGLVLPEEPAPVEAIVETASATEEAPIVEEAPAVEEASITEEIVETAADSVSNESATEAAEEAPSVVEAAPAIVSDTTAEEESATEKASSQEEEVELSERKARMAAIRAEQAKILGIAISLPTKAPKISEERRDTDDEWNRSDMQLKHQPAVVNRLLQEKEEAEERERLEAQLAAEHQAAMEAEAAAAEEAAERATTEVAAVQLVEESPNEEAPNEEALDEAVVAEATIAPEEEPPVEEAQEIDQSAPHQFTTWLRHFSGKAPEETAEANELAEQEAESQDVEVRAGEISQSEMAAEEAEVSQPLPPESAPEIVRAQEPAPVETAGSDDLARFANLISKQREKAREAAPAEKPQPEAKEAIADWVVSETYALLLERQGKTEKAIQVYQKLRLLYPEKSSFFASRITALEAEI